LYFFIFNFLFLLKMATQNSRADEQTRALSPAQEAEQASSEALDRLLDRGFWSPFLRTRGGRYFEVKRFCLAVLRNFSTADLLKVLFATRGFTREGLVLDTIRNNFEYIHWDEYFDWNNEPFQEADYDSAARSFMAGRRPVPYSQDDLLPTDDVPREDDLLRIEDDLLPIEDENYFRNPPPPEDSLRGPLSYKQEINEDDEDEIDFLAKQENEIGLPDDQVINEDDEDEIDFLANQENEIEIPDAQEIIEDEDFNQENEIDPPPNLENEIEDEYGRIWRGTGRVDDDGLEIWFPVLQGFPLWGAATHSNPTNPENDEIEQSRIEPPANPEDDEDEEDDGFAPFDDSEVDEDENAGFRRFHDLEIENAGFRRFDDLEVENTGFRRFYDLEIENAGFDVLPDN
jgi:hypothetical protein